MHSARLALVLAAALVLCTPPCPAAGQDRPGPRAAAAWSGPLARFLTGGVRFFRKVISPVDGPRCTMIPTCSEYALDALNKHGPFIGFMMAADRIVHEYEEQRWARQVRTPGGIRFLDPVEENDFWFSGSGAEE